MLPYQVDGALWLASKTHALLGDEMGLGKSAQAITAADMIGAKEVLVVCPATARINWHREFDKFSILGTSPTVVSYDYLTANGTALSAPAWDLVIADESHFCKTPEAQRAQALYGKLAHSTKRLWCLSGTPAPNHGGELWTMLRTFGVTTLEYETFITRYCTVSAYRNRIRPSGTKDPESIRQMLRPIMLRRTKAEVLKDLPVISFHDHFVDAAPLSDADMAVYFAERYAINEAEKLRREISLQRERLALAGETLRSDEEMQAFMEREFEYLSTLRLWVGASKVAGVAELLTEELEAGAYAKVVVWGIHTSVINMLAERLARFNPVVIYGATSETARQAAIDRFQTDPTCRVFVGNIRAAGTAITLTAAHEEVFCEYAWTPADNAQAAARCHRIGQVHPVRCRFAVLPGGIDEVVLRVVRRKTRELAAIMAPPEDIFA